MCIYVIVLMKRALNAGKIEFAILLSYERALRELSNGMLSVTLTCLLAKIRPLFCRAVINSLLWKRASNVKGKIR